MQAQEISKTLHSLGDPETAEHSQRYFKTGKGQYGEGDRFLGIRVPILRKQAARFGKTPLEEVLLLLHSPWHEERLFALLLLVSKYQKGNEAEKEAIYNLYMENARFINNWDLVDTSAPKIVGPHLIDRDKTPLYAFIRSDNLWERRIAVLATFYFIDRNCFGVSLEFADMLLRDEEELIHKAVGWMLREIGKRDAGAEKAFLNPRYRQMPRTMLRYAIEKYPETERKRYLRGEI